MLKKFFKNGEETILSEVESEEIIYIAIHFTPRQDYMYVSKEHFEEDDAGNIYTNDSNDDYYLISGTFVYLERTVKGSLSDTLLEVKKRYNLSEPTLIEIN